MKNIFVIGSTNTDMVVKASQFPLPGETRLGGKFFMSGGGKGANQAVAAARSGGQVSFVTKLGRDIFGTECLGSFKKENINTEYVFFSEDEPSGTALIFVNEEGENMIVVASGANSRLLPEDIDKVKNLDEADIVLMQLEIPMETITYTAGIVKSNHQKIIINPAPAQMLEDELLNGLFLIIPNETEAHLLTGITVMDVNTAAAAADVFLNKGVQHVIITMGSQGVYFQDRNKRLVVPAPQVKAVDTTAAGDVFCGALSVALTEEMGWDKAIEFAVQAATLSVTRLGAQSAIPYRKELNG